MRSIAKYSLSNRLDSIFSRVLQKLVVSLKLLGLEGCIWLATLIYLAFFVNPDTTHFSFCPISLLQIDSCPGCGVGKSIAYLFNGEIFNSFNTHPFGAVAVVLLSNRIVTLLFKNRRIYG